MRSLSILLVSLGLTFVSGSVFACGSGYPVLSTEKDDGTKIGLFISSEQVEATVSWDPGKSEPPLSVSDAYRLAREWGKKEYVRYDSIEVRELKLTKYRCSSVSNRWYYVIDFAPVIDGNELWGSGNWLAVLMDGTIIGPREY